MKLKFSLTKEMKVLIVILVAGLFFGLMFVNNYSNMYMLEGFAGVDTDATVSPTNLNLDKKFAKGSVSIQQALGVANPQ